MNNEVTIITVADLKLITSISKGMEESLLEPHIDISERMHVLDILGDALTTELKSQITGGTISALNQLLLSKYVKPLACYATWFEASPFLYTKTQNKGLVKQSSNNSENLSKEEFLEMYRQPIKDKVAFFRNELVKYLNSNSSSYPLYRCDVPPTSFSSGFYLGRY